MSKLTAGEHNLGSASPLERWAFFLRNAANYSAGDLHRLLPGPEFDEAVEVLEMNRRNPREEELYQARLKLWRDEESRLRYAEEKGLSQGLSQGRAEGREEGREEGRIDNQIDVAQKLQRLLGLPTISREALAQIGTDDLGKLVDELMAKLQGRIQ